MELYAALKTLNISYDETEHEPVFTVEQARAIKRKVQGTACKNLFLTDKTRTKYLLAVLEAGKQADLKQIAAFAGTSRLSFADKDELYEILHLMPGSVSPLGILHDKKNRVTILIDRELQGKCLLFHPNINTKTLAIQYEDLIRFIKYLDHDYRLM